MEAYERGRTEPSSDESNGPIALSSPIMPGHEDEMLRRPGTQPNFDAFSTRQSVSWSGRPRSSEAPVSCTVHR